LGLLLWPEKYGCGGYGGKMLAWKVRASAVEQKRKDVREKRRFANPAFDRTAGRDPRAQEMQWVKAKEKDLNG
jgi:hypothetical protein